MEFQAQYTNNGRKLGPPAGCYQELLSDRFVERASPGVCCFGLLCVWNVVIVPNTMRDLSVHTGQVVITGTEAKLLLLIANDTIVVCIPLLICPLHSIGIGRIFNVMFLVIGE